jgi:hypothetical protein
MTIGKGRIAAIRGTISGEKDGTSLVECRSVWKMGTVTKPNWPVQHGYLIEVTGNPSFRLHLEPGDGWSGAASTALPVVNAIPAICASPPGIVNLGELPLVIAAPRPS